MATNPLTLIKRAKETAEKNRAAAIRNTSKLFDDSIAGYEAAIKQLTFSAANAKNAAPQKVTLRKKIIAKNKVAPSKKSIKKSASLVPGSYPKDGTILEKLIFFISESKRFISIREIAEQFKKREPNSKPEEIKRRFSKHMNKFRQQGKIVSYNDSKTSRVYYGLPAYIKNGKVVKAHTYIDNDYSE
jgi:hypothetical protein